MIQVSRVRDFSTEIASGILELVQGELQEETFNKFIQNEHNFLFVAKEHSKVVGCCYGYILNRFHSKPMFYIHSIDVIPSHQGKGIGTNLIQECLKEAREYECYKGFVITSKDNIKANKLYQTTNARQINDNDVIYEWKLTN